MDGSQYNTLLSEVGQFFKLEPNLAHTSSRHRTANLRAFEADESCRGAHHFVREVVAGAGAHALIFDLQLHAI
jgi:hypothetical protein